MLNSLREDVGALSGDLKTVNGKLGSIMSLLMGVASRRTASNDAVHRGGGSSGDSGSHFESGTDGSAAATSTEAFHGGGVGSQQRRGRGGESDGSSHREGHTSYEVGTPLGCYEAPCLPTDHRWYSRSSSSTNRYSVGSHQVDEQTDEACFEVICSQMLGLFNNTRNVPVRSMLQRGRSFDRDWLL